MGRRGRTNFVDECFYFVTTSVVRNTPAFLDPSCCDLLLQTIRFYREKYNFGVLGWVIMPSHLHWIVRTNPTSGTISHIMRDVKKYSAWDIMEEIRLRRDTAMLNNFQEEARRYAGQSNKFWEGRFDDQVIRNAGMLRTKLSYIHNNPVNAGLVERAQDYVYSSAQAYMVGDHSLLEVETEWSGG